MVTGYRVPIFAQSPESDLEHGVGVNPDSACFPHPSLLSSPQPPPPDNDPLSVVTMTDKWLHLKMNELLAEMPGHALQRIGGNIQEVRIQQGEVLFREGDEGDAVYFVVEGRVGIEKDGVRLLSRSATNAGHPYPYVYRKRSGRLETLSSTSDSR